MHERGFTLIELIITVTVVAILAGVVAPGFNSFIKDRRLNSQINAIITAVHSARAEASSRRKIVTLCASTDLSSCNTANWESGWIMFTDTNNNGNAVIDGDDVLIQVHEPLEGGNTLRDANFNFSAGQLTFARDGFLHDPDPVPGTLTLCDDRGATEAKAIVVNISGTARHAIDESGNGIVNSDVGSADGDSVTCP